jgi:hypothetical protein
VSSPKIVAQISREFAAKPEHIHAALEMLDAGMLPPFIARVRRIEPAQLADDEPGDAVLGVQQHGGLGQRGERGLDVAASGGIILEFFELAAGHRGRQQRSADPCLRVVTGHGRGPSSWTVPSPVRAWCPTDFAAL